MSDVSVLYTASTPLGKLLTNVEGITLTNGNDHITSSLFPSSNTGSGNRLALLDVNFLLIMFLRKVCKAIQINLFHERINNKIHLFFQLSH